MIHKDMKINSGNESYELPFLAIYEPPKGPFLHVHDRLHSVTLSPPIISSSPLHLSPVVPPQTAWPSSCGPSSVSDFPSSLQSCLVARRFCYGLVGSVFVWLHRQRQVCGWPSRNQNQSRQPKVKHWIKYIESILLLRHSIPWIR